ALQGTQPECLLRNPPPRWYSSLALPDRTIEWCFRPRWLLWHCRSDCKGGFPAKPYRRGWSRLGAGFPDGSAPVLNADAAFLPLHQKAAIRRWAGTPALGFAKMPDPIAFASYPRAALSAQSYHLPL